MLASLGGADDNSIVLWDVATGEPICGSPTNSDFVLRMAFLNHDSTKLVTAGNYNLKLWTYDRWGAEDAPRARAGCGTLRGSHLRGGWRVLTM